jgi:Ca2+-binding RTX toxin-like protein
MADYNVTLGTNTADSLIVSNTAGTNDSLALLAGNDTVTGSASVDIIDFGLGNDQLTSPGDYTGGTILGGSGNDSFAFNGKVSGSLVDGQSNNDSLSIGKSTT